MNNEFKVTVSSELCDDDIYVSPKGEYRLRALQEDYTKLLIQTQAEMMQKDKYILDLATTDTLLRMANRKIERLELALNEKIIE